MTAQRAKSVFIRLLLTAAVIMYCSVRAIDELNAYLNSRPVKHLLVEYMQETLRVAFSADDAEV